MKYNALKLKQIFPNFQIQIKQKRIAQERRKSNEVERSDYEGRSGQVYINIAYHWFVFTIYLKFALYSFNFLHRIPSTSPA